MNAPVYLLPGALSIAIYFVTLGQVGRASGRALAYRALSTALALGMTFALVDNAARGWFLRWLDLGTKAMLATDRPLVLLVLLALAPLSEALKVVACLPAWRSRRFTSPFDGVMIASAGAVGFAAIEGAAYLHGAPWSWLGVARVLLALPGHVFFATAWGYALGRDRARHRLPGRTFLSTWLLSAVLRGAYEMLLFSPGTSAVVAVTPMLFGIAAVTAVALRQLEGARPSRPSRKTFLPSLPPPPSLGAMRAALHRAERPVLVGWIGSGALVTTGLMMTAVVAAVVIGRRAGVDFSIVDEGEVTSTAPVVLLGTAILSAFPVSGYLVARASGVESVLEPALSAGVAIAATLVMLGVTAPVTLVFALAFAPVAFGLACFGAWVAIGAR